MVMMFKSVLAWAHLAVGVSYPILEHTIPSLPHLEVEWISSLRNFLATIKAGLQVDEHCVPTVQRQGDTYIMRSRAYSWYQRYDALIIAACISRL